MSVTLIRGPHPAPRVVLVNKSSQVLKVRDWFI